MNDERYFNFPIALMKNVKTDSERNNFLSCALYYHLAKHCLKIEECNTYEESPNERFKRSADFHNVILNGDVTSRRVQGENLLFEYSEEKVFSGINTKVFWDFYSQEKTEFEWNCLFAYLGLKSIIGNKEFAKSNNNHLLARMSGFKNADEVTEFNFSFSRYQFDKIKTELQYNWFLNYYATYTRGFYFSFDKKCKLDKLVFEAEKRKLKNKEAKLKSDKNDARLLALNRLRESPP